jgi:hypothetical protein
VNIRIIPLIRLSIALNINFSIYSQPTTIPHYIRCNEHLFFTTTVITTSSCCILRISQALGYYPGLEKKYKLVNKSRSSSTECNTQCCKRSKKSYKALS